MGANLYKCIYCDKKFKRIDMTDHLSKYHMSELPEGFTPLRVTFHIVNKKPFTYSGACRVCKQSTDWDEKKGRYNLLCNNKSCHEKWAEKMKNDMGDKMGSNRPTATEEGLQKMLAARKISGKYKWSDGKEFTYTGSYELKTLEFMDKVMEIKSEDLMVPGPVLEYELDGKKHLYLTDIFYIPYNLIIEVKDGGNNPNTNPQLYETRRKKVAKEKWVIEKTDYNYLRLTNKDFSQLLAIFADIKMKLVENTKERSIHVNENMTIPGAIHTAGSPNAVYIVNYLQNNVFSNGSKIAVSDTPKFDTLVTIVNGVLTKVDESFLKNTKYNTYVVENSLERVSNFVNKNIGNAITESDLYKAIFNHPRITEDQIMYEENCQEYEDYYYNLHSLNESIKKYIVEGEK